MDGIVKRVAAVVVVLLVLLGVASCGENAPAPAPVAERTITIDLLALDLAICGRCTRTDANLSSALRTVSERLRGEGVDVQVRTTIVATAEEATRLRLESSPTIRVDGRDIALELRESKCRDCGDLCGPSDSVDCRVWVWRGQEYLEAPPEMIVEAVLQAYREGPTPAAPPTSPFRLPENLRRFFEARSPLRDPASR